MKKTTRTSVFQKGPRLPIHQHKKKGQHKTWISLSILRKLTRDQKILISKNAVEIHTWIEGPRFQGRGTVTWKIKSGLGALFYTSSCDFKSEIKISAVCMLQSLALFIKANLIWNIAHNGMLPSQREASWKQNTSAALRTAQWGRKATNTKPSWTILRYYQ